MSKIEIHEVCTNLDESHRAPRINPSAHDWENISVHDMDRGTVIAFAKLIENFLFETFQISCIPTGLGREYASRYIKFAKYLLASINLFDSSQAIANHNLNGSASQIHAFLKLPGLFADRHEHCWAKT